MYTYVPIIQSNTYTAIVYPESTPFLDLKLHGSVHKQDSRKKRDAGEQDHMTFNYTLSSLSYSHSESLFQSFSLDLSLTFDLAFCLRRS